MKKIQTHKMTRRLLLTWFASEGAQDWNKATLPHSKANYGLDIIAICLLSFLRFSKDSDVSLTVKSVSLHVAD